MTQPQAPRALTLEVSGSESGQIFVQVIAQSAQTQRVSYALKTTGGSTTSHKGATTLRANEPATLSNVRFSAARQWCVTLDVEEELGQKYSIEKGSSCL